MNERVFFRIISYLGALFIFISSLTGISAGSAPAGPDPSLETPVWPAWVHEHWVWENTGTQDTIRNLVEDYLDNDIPVGAIIIDNPWATGIGTFVPDPALYPDMEEQIKMYHDKDIRVMLWATCMVNEDASNFQEGKDKGYYLSNGKTVKWWSGKGAFLDYTNPEAVDWWHKQMDIVLNMGIDGWKVDGADPYVMLLMPATGFGDRHVTWKEYRNAFYRDFFEYTREKLGNDRVISARPVNDVALRIGLPLVFTERDVNFAGWVGDNDNDWGGLRHALNDMLASSNYNFVSYGSDIGGFRSEGEKYKDVFIRWAQLGAFCPVMENGGSGEHRPWMYDTETADVYRKFVNLHHELIPYIYSQAAYSYELVKPTMRPQPGIYQYLLGDDILVAPFFQEGNSRTVVFPKGEWIDMFDETKTYTGGIRKLEFGFDEFPAFIRKGAIIPLDVTNGANGHGSEHSAGYTTVLMYPQSGEKKFGLYEENEKGSMLSYTKGGDSLTVNCTPTKRALLFKVSGEPAPAAVKNASGEALTRAASMEALVATQAGYFVDGGVTWYAIKDASEGMEIQVRY